MKRCLMKTQSSGGLAVGADSRTFASMKLADDTATRNSASVRTVVDEAMPIARAAASRSAPCAVGVG